MKSSNRKTVKELKDIQAQHMARWKAILIPEVYAELEKLIAARTTDLHDTKVLYYDMPTTFTNSEWDLVPRGTDIDQSVHVLLNNPPKTKSSESVQPKQEPAIKDLLHHLKACLDYIEMTMAHSGSMNVEQIMEELRHVRTVSVVQTCHHLGCPKTSRSVNLEAIRKLLV